VVAVVVVEEAYSILVGRLGHTLEERIRIHKDWHLF